MSIKVGARIFVKRQSEAEILASSFVFQSVDFEYNYKFAGYDKTRPHEFLVESNTLEKVAVLISAHDLTTTSFDDGQPVTLHTAKYRLQGYESAL